MKGKAYKTNKLLA